MSDRKAYARKRITFTGAKGTVAAELIEYLTEMEEELGGTVMRSRCWCAIQAELLPEALARADYSPEEVRRIATHCVRYLQGVIFTLAANHDIPALDIYPAAPTQLPSGTANSQALDEKGDGMLVDPGTTPDNSGKLQPTKQEWRNELEGLRPVDMSGLTAFAADETKDDSRQDNGR